MGEEIDKIIIHTVDFWVGSRSLVHEKGYHTFDLRGYPEATEGWTIDGMKALHAQPKWKEWIVKTYDTLWSDDAELDLEDKRLPGLRLHGSEHPDKWTSITEPVEMDETADLYATAHNRYHRREITWNELLPKTKTIDAHGFEP